LVIEVEVANENLPSKKAQYKQIVEILKLTRIQKSSKVNLLSKFSWPMTPTMAITTREVVHHIMSKQLFYS